MKFYVTSVPAIGTVACEFSLSKAVKQGKAYGAREFTVERVTINGSPREALRRLLGNIGGYADDTETVYDSLSAASQETTVTEAQS